MSMTNLFLSKLTYFIITVLLHGSTGLVFSQGALNASFSQISIMIEPSNDHFNTSNRSASDSLLMVQILNKTNQLLLDSGITNTFDKQLYYENIVSRQTVSTNANEKDIFQIAIENAPADISIKAGFRYIPIDNTKKWKLIIQLIAVDNYNAMILASGKFESKDRAFPNPSSAIETLFNIDAKGDLSGFLSKIIIELKNINENGRKIKLKFEVTEDSKVFMDSKIGDHFLDELIELCLRENVNFNQIKIFGQSASYLDVELTLRPFQQSGYASILEFKRSLLSCLYSKNVIIKHTNVVGNWLVFSF